MGLTFKKAADASPSRQQRETTSPSGESGAPQNPLQPADDGVGEVPSPDDIQKMSDRLDLEAARCADDYDQATDQLARHYHACRKVYERLDQQIKALTPIAEGVVYGDLPLDQGNARAIIRWKNLLLQRHEAKIALTTSFGATQKPGQANPPGDLLG